jgi:hypothetical protein
VFVYLFLPQDQMAYCSEHHGKKPRHRERKRFRTPVQAERSPVAPPSFLSHSMRQQILSDTVEEGDTILLAIPRRRVLTAIGSPHDRWFH